MGVGGQRHTPTVQVRKISPRPFFDPRTAYFIETQFYVSVVHKVASTVSGKVSCLRLGQTAISTAVIRCRETRSVQDSKLPTTLSIQSLPYVAFHNKISYIKLYCSLINQRNVHYTALHSSVMDR
jgi:hypothetical protein